jgi:hypothetical protein
MGVGHRCAGLAKPYPPFIKLFSDVTGLKKGFGLWARFSDSIWLKYTNVLANL